MSEWISVYYEIIKWIINSLKLLAKPKLDNEEICN